MASHWYDKQGNTRYEVEAASGKMRPTNIKDARKHGWVTSVSTILGTVAQPGLEYWKVQQVLKAAYESNPGPLTFEQYAGKITAESKKIGEDAAKRGNEIHNHLEQYLLSNQIDEKDAVFLVPVIELLHENFDLGECIPERSFYHSSGYGGKVDLSHDEYIIDFKTKTTDNFDKDLAFDNHLMQLAAYRKGLDKPNAKCYNIFISTAKPGLVKLHEWTDKEVQRGEKMFNLLLDYWKLANNFEVKNES